MEKCNKPKWQIRDVDHGKVKSFSSYDEMAQWIINGMDKTVKIKEKSNVKSIFN